MTYWELNIIFLTLAILLAMTARVVRHTPRLGALLITAVVLVGMTAVFDNIMIGIGLVGYNTALISGAMVGIAPLEDFAYAIGAVILLPALWSLLPPSRRGAHGARPAPKGGDE
ncbi:MULTISPECIES: lycopene cyclase domain-containing protein [Subtercola]|uniref:Lycopene cyclase domain-containing protein n=1 Tax=Subtercola vilae TaxID=2056433 RepID=A0A4T2C325_9MICO|nr:MULTISPECIES: lycopene cyclase domain-containing protein [Subtercola]MEA9984094.1 lycopene cyclase domain-containing protein [Subtercola sp. RTI3]TIH38685.1 lycopene cyclase domain-containing protein [Subtercola vilae]